VSIFSGRHFPRDVILWAVRWYCRYGVSYRDLEEMFTERGVPVDHTTIYRWVQRYAPELDKQTRWYRRVGGWRPRTPEATTKCKALCSCWSRRCSAGARNRLHTLMSLGLRTCDQR
jgi:transposase, IS6 family